jgi:hypothetical protein
MSTIIIEVYDAFKEAGVSEEKSIAAARALADYESHFVRIEPDLTDVKAGSKVVKAKIEDGRSVPSFEMVMKFLRAYGVDIEVFLL